MITGSDLGVFIKSSASFTYAFSVTFPSNGVDWQTLDEPLNYSGGFGSVWVWIDSQNDANSIYYSVAV